MCHVITATFRHVSVLSYCGFFGHILYNLLFSHIYNYNKKYVLPLMEYSDPLQVQVKVCKHDPQNVLKVTKVKVLNSEEYFPHKCIGAEV